MPRYYPTSDDISLLVSRGLVTKTSFDHKFGAVPAMSVNTTGTIWDKNDTLYPWSVWNTPGVVTVDRANINDANKTITIVGLDANYEPVTDSIILTNATGNTGTTNFKRVYRAYIVDGSNNIGSISIKKGEVEIAVITAGKGQTLMAIYTVPAGKTGYIYKGVCTAEASADGTGEMYIRYFGQDSFRVGHSFEVSGAQFYNYEFSFPIPIPEKSDVDVRISTRSNNGRYTAAFDILLVDNDAAT